MWWTLVLATLAALPLHIARADFTSADWRYFKAIQTPELGSEALVELPLDREVFEASSPGEADLRMVEADGLGEVAYQLVAQSGRLERQSLQGKIRDLGHVADEHSTFVVDLGQTGNLHNQVEILTDSQNFQRQVTIETSRDGLVWAQLEEGTEIFDFTVKERGFNATNTEVAYPESSLRYLRVNIINGGERPLNISGATVSSVQYQPAVETAYPAEIIGRTEDADARTSVTEFDLGSEGLPTNRVSLRTSSVNFHRTASVEGSNDRQTWMPLSGDVDLYSYRTAKFVGDSLDIAYGEATSRYLRLVIQNRDDPPLTVEGIDVSGIARRVLFKGQPGAVYALYYGNSEAGAPAYDLERLLPYLDTENPIAATLGPQQDNPQFAGPQTPASEGYPWLIPAGVAVAAVVLAAILFGIFRQVRKVLPPPDPAG